VSPTSESGGATTQAGISFQNRIAVLRMAAMLAKVEMGGTSTLGRVVSVRIEAPVEVDDILVTFSGGAREYIQAKMAVSTSGDAWRDMWVHFYRQHESARVRSASDADVITLAVKWATRMSDLETLLARARASSSEEEWLNERLTNSQRELVEGIRAALLNKEITMGDAELFRLCRRVHVWLLGFEGDPLGADTFEKETRRILNGLVSPESTVFSALLEVASNIAPDRRELTYEELVQILKHKGFGLTGAPSAHMTLTSDQSERARQNLTSLKRQWETVRRILSALREAYYETPYGQAEEREALKIKIERREAELAQLAEELKAREAEIL
jgi:hypothetical protein